MRAAHSAPGATLEVSQSSSNSTTFPPSKRLVRKGLMTSLMASHISIPHLPPSKAVSKVARWLSKRWSNLLLAVCVAGFAGVAAFALSLTDNYTCVGGEHVARAYESPWTIASQRCSGDVTHAMRDIVTINGAAPYEVGMVVVVPGSGG